MKLSSIISVIIFLLIGGLLINSTLNLDIAVTKNNALINSKKLEIENFTDIDSLKNYAKSNLDFIRQSKIKSANSAEREIVVISVIFILQIFLWRCQNKKTFLF